MELIEQLAEAALLRDSLRLRSLVQDIARANINWSMILRPKTNDLRLLALSASLAELLASREKQEPPSSAIPNLKIVVKCGKVLVTHGTKTYTPKPDAALS